MTNPAAPMRILATGGTMDKCYDPIAGKLSFADSGLARMIDQARVAPAPPIEVAMLIDSLEMTDAHRQTILQCCLASAQPRIVIVHGTDTMVQTARVLGTAGIAKTIVLTGAMVPYTIEHSDALFNLGYAMACADLLAHGVYIAIGGRCFDWDKVRKNRALGRFEAAASEKPDAD